MDQIAYMHIHMYWNYSSTNFSAVYLPNIHYNIVTYRIAVEHNKLIHQLPDAIVHIQICTVEWIP